MAVDVTLKTITTGYNLATINENFTTIDTALADAVSRSGQSPNTMTADLDMNSQQLINLANPTVGGNAINKTYGDANYGGAASDAAAVSAAAALVSENNAETAEDGAETAETNALTSETNAALSAAAAQAAVAGLRWKDKVTVATTVNITLSGEQTIDGVLTSSDRVLVKSQSAQAENGIYVSNASAWVRATDMNTWDEVPSAVVPIEVGTSQSDTAYICTSDEGGTLETTAITWQSFGSGDLLSANNLSDVANAGTSRINLGVAIGTDVQAFDADTAKLDVNQSYTAPQRAESTTLTDGTLLDMNTSQDWDWTPAATDVLSFTNITVGQRGMILLNNPSAYAITKASAVHCDSDFLATVSAAGVYMLSYWTDASGAIVYVVNSQALAT